MRGGDVAHIDILHVEDDRAFADLCAEFIEREDEAFRVRTAFDPTEALPLLENEPFDCIVSDYEMPGRTGVDLLRTVRGRGYERPFILFTGKGSEEIASEAISAGVTDYLQKDGGADQYAILANRIRNAVESFRLEREADRYYRQLEAITTHSADAIVTMDADGRIRFANPAVEDHFGYTPDELIGEPLTVVIPERLRDRHREGVTRYLRTGERSFAWTNLEFPGLHKDGSEIPLSISYGEYTREDERRFIGIMRERQP